LSYVVNAVTGTPPGLFRDCYYGPSTTPTNQPLASSIVRLSDIRAPARTVMLSENEYPSRDWSLCPSDSQLASSNLTAANVGFLFWPPTSTLLSQGLGATTFTVGTTNVSIHPGIVNVTFCDGHVESLSDDTLCGTYSAVP
jgi:prepilin-type processing-associated H-X9-DG protein